MSQAENWVQDERTHRQGQRRFARFAAFCRYDPSASAEHPGGKAVPRCQVWMRLTAQPGLSKFRGRWPGFGWLDATRIHPTETRALVCKPQSVLGYRDKISTKLHHQPNSNSHVRCERHRYVTASLTIRRSLFAYQQRLDPAGTQITLLRALASPDNTFFEDSPRLGSHGPNDSLRPGPKV